jgi:hypothetical protein
MSEPTDDQTLAKVFAELGLLWPPVTQPFDKHRAPMATQQSRSKMESTQ